MANLLLAASLAHRLSAIKLEVQDPSSLQSLAELVASIPNRRSAVEALGMARHLAIERIPHAQRNDNHECYMSMVYSADSYSLY